MDTLQETFFKLPEKSLRDLVWAVSSPALLDTSWSPAQPLWLDELLLQAGPWQHWQLPAESPHSRLGLVFEQLWQSWLQEQHIALAANLQIASTERTLGELDLLLKLPQQPLHLELAMKFYLGHNDEWIGPNRRDLLANKIAHTRDHQLPLAHTEAAQTTIADLGFSNTDALRSEALMRGCLFHPVDTNIKAALPLEVNPNHWQGWWCHAHQLADQVSRGDWIILAKDQWLSPALSPVKASADELVSLVVRHFDWLKVPLSIARVERTEFGWAEVERAMVVSDQWPQAFPK